MLNNQVLLCCQHEVLQQLPQAVRLEILASGCSLGSLLVVALHLLLKLGWAAGWTLLPPRHIPLLHNLRQ